MVSFFFWFIFIYYFNVISCTGFNNLNNTLHIIFLDQAKLCHSCKVFVLIFSSWDNGLIITPITFLLLNVPVAGLFSTLILSCSSSMSSWLSPVKKKSSLKTGLLEFVIVELSFCCIFPGIRHRCTAQLNVRWSSSSLSTDSTCTLTVESKETGLAEMILSAKRCTLMWLCRARLCFCWRLSWDCRTSRVKKTVGTNVSELPCKLRGQLGELIKLKLFIVLFPISSLLSINEGQEDAPLRKPLPGEIGDDLTQRGQDDDGFLARFDCSDGLDAAAAALLLSNTYTGHFERNRDSFLRVLALSDIPASP